MPTTNEIRTNWKRIRSDLGNLICSIDGKESQIGNQQENWDRGYKAGESDGFQRGREDGMWFAWNLILSIGTYMDNDIKEIFCLGDISSDPLFTVVKKYTPDEAALMLKAYENKPKVKTNADMFLETFPDIDSIDKLVKIIKNTSERNCMMRSEWWDKPYMGKNDERSD